MKQKKLLTFILSILFSSYLLLPDCAFAVQDVGERTLKIGGDNNYPPYEFLDNNNFRGFNVDIIRAIAIELGLEVELIPDSWEATMEALKDGELDAVQGMTITPERDEIYDFTDEIVINSQNIFVLQNTGNIAGIDDLKNKKVAIQAKDVTKEIIDGIPNIAIMEKVNQQEALQALTSGEVDAYVGNRLTGIYYVQSFGLTETVKIVGEPLYSTKYSIAVQSGNTALLQLLNSGLKAIKDNGTYEKIYRKWFGEAIPDVSQKWKRLLYITLVALLFAIILIYVIYYWNKSLKKEVEIRTKEIIELNNIAMHNDKMQSLGNLSAGIAHELRNPLTSIKAFVDLIPSKFEDKAFREELIKIVPKEINRLNDLVSSLLDYSKPKNPNPKKILLEDILSDVLPLLRQKISEKKILVTTDCKNIYIYSDESQVKQILINIILNSIDAIENNGEIHIKGNVSGNKAIISIRDNGIGIPGEMKDKLFDPFYSSKKTSYGIGLSVTHRLVRENKGEIKIFSEVNKGTTVLIYMPTKPNIREDEKDV